MNFIQKAKLHRKISDCSDEKTKKHYNIRISEKLLKKFSKKADDLNIERSDFLRYIISRFLVDSEFESAIVDDYLDYKRSQRKESEAI